MRLLCKVELWLSWGFDIFFVAGKTLREKTRNYRRVSNFRLYPVAFIPGGKVSSMHFEVRFYGTGKRIRMTIKHPDYYDWKKVCSKVMEGEGYLTEGVIAPKDFNDLIADHISTWSANPETYRVKKPVQNIGLQQHLLDPEFKNWKPEDFAFFYNAKQGVLNINGEPYEDSQVNLNK